MYTTTQRQQKYFNSKYKFKDILAVCVCAILDIENI